MISVSWDGLFEAHANAQRGKAIDWGVYARAYDLLPQVFSAYRENLEIVTDALKRYIEKSDARVCDLGAGTGIYIDHLARIFENWRFTHVDSNPGMNRLAKTKYETISDGRVAVIEDSAHSVRFPTEVFDAVICVNALYAMNPQHDVLRKVFKWLKPGGVFVCIDFGRRQGPTDWLFEFARQAVTRQIDPAITKKALSVTANVFLQAIKGSAGQSTGEYWMHDLRELQMAIEGCGLEILEGFVCYRGYCDGVVARKR